jgi:hypothetical protein
MSIDFMPSFAASLAFLIDENIKASKMTPRQILAINRTCKKLNFSKFAVLLETIKRAKQTQQKKMKI